MTEERGVAAGGCAGGCDYSGHCNVFGVSGGVSAYCRRCGRVGFLVSLAAITGAPIPDIRYAPDRGFTAENAR